VRRGIQVDSTRPLVAVLGVSRRTGHLLSSDGLLSFALSELKAPHSERAGHLGFDIVRSDGARILIDLTTDMPIAIATQLDEMRSGAASEAARKQRAAGPPAKRRAATDR
jgi:hypothetical protein